MKCERMTDHKSTPHKKEEKKQQPCLHILTIKHNKFKNQLTSKISWLKSPDWLGGDCWGGGWCSSGWCWFNCGGWFEWWLMSNDSVLGTIIRSPRLTAESRAISAKKKTQVENYSWVIEKCVLYFIWFLYSKVYKLNRSYNLPLDRWLECFVCSFIVISENFRGKFIN